MATAQITITAVFLYDANEVQNRSISVFLSTGATVKIEPLYEGWQQYNAIAEELWVSKKVADKYNGWLHGKRRPADNSKWDTTYFRPSNLN